MKLNHTITGDALTVLKTFPDESVNCCVTSPPYWQLRNYEHPDQLGLEKTPEEYVKKLVDIFREVKRVLKKDGNLWLVIGDTYAAYWGEKYGKPNSFGKSRYNIGSTPPKKESPDFSKTNFKPKDLIGIPWMVAFALRDDGWFLRQDIIWNKPNPMPESVTDRCTKSHEYIFLLSKSKKYFFDAEAIKTPISDSSIQRLSQDIENQKGRDRVPGKTNGNMKATRPHGITRDRLLDYVSKEKHLRTKVKRGGYANESDLPLPDALANKRSVWTVNTEPYSDAHFATFPQKLIIDMIKAGCPIDGIVLDPFMGSGTTGIVARKLNRNYIGIDLGYEDVRNRRLEKELGMFN
jgi:DNA modification methylase